MPAFVKRTVALIELTCYRCNIDFSMAEWFYERCKQYGETFYCPRGHGQVFRSPEVTRLRKQVEQLEAQKTHLADQRDAAERSLSAQRGQNTKLRKRIANGVCPCCHRSFTNLARHMAGQHPDYAEESK